MATFTDKLKRRIAPDSSYRIEVLPQVGKDLAKLGLTDEHYEPNFFEKMWWPIEKRIEAIKDFPKEVKWFIQRGRQGYATKDVWDMHSYLQEVIPKMLRELVTHETMFSSHPMGYKEIKNNKDWKRVVLKMAKDIEEGGKYDDLLENWSEKKRLAKLKQFDEGMEALHKYWFSLWD